MARKFLYVVVAMVVIVVVTLLALRIWSEEVTQFVFVPTTEFKEQLPLPVNIYNDPAMWYSRPGEGPSDPARWLPDGLDSKGETLHVAVFFIHPTSYLAKQAWNGPLDDRESEERGALFVRAMASPFNQSESLWAPRYRQAAFGSFLSDRKEATEALDAAYRDVEQAFDHFLASIDKDVPIVLAGHSQGAFHLRRLLRDHIAGRPIARRIAAVYAIGWPISLQHDLPLMGLPACAAPDQPGCIMSWLSYAEPADTGMILHGYARRTGLDGQAVGGSPFLCSNPLTGGIGGAAGADADLGTLVPDAHMRSGKLVSHMVPARCGGDGFLYIGDAPDLGPYVLPGNNYHVYDIPLFWANLRADVARRVKAWKP